MMTTNITLLNTSTSHTVYWEESFYQNATSIDPKKMKKKPNFSILALFFKSINIDIVERRHGKTFIEQKYQLKAKN